MRRNIVYVATYPPRQCGIATFTQDLREAVGEGRVYALGPKDGASARPGTGRPEVMGFLNGHRPVDYLHAAAVIDASGAAVVSIQHEYGIYGGRDGVNLLAMTDRLATPYVATLHTVLRAPSPSQRGILQELAGRSAGVVVMSQTAADLLAGMYDVDRARIHVIPHGVPDLPRADAAQRKAELGLGMRPVVLSFGLIGSGKGYELAIEAMRTVRQSVPDAVYVVLGATHPDLLRREGERYRDSLQGQADLLGLGDSIRFENRFVGGPELGRWLQAADVFVTPYPKSRPDRVRNPVIRHGCGPADRVDALSVRARGPVGRSRRPGPARGTGASGRCRCGAPARSRTSREDRRTRLCPWPPGDLVERGGCLP